MQADGTISKWMPKQVHRLHTPQQGPEARSQDSASLLVKSGTEILKGIWTKNWIFGPAALLEG